MNSELATYRASFAWLAENDPSFVPEMKKSLTADLEPKAGVNKLGRFRAEKHFPFSEEFFGGARKIRIVQNVFL